MGSNQVKALGFSPETVITEDLLEKLWNKYNKDGLLKHDAATSLLRDLLKGIFSLSLSLLSFFLSFFY